ITTGFHLHFNKAGIHDSYVTPVPDPRLNLRRHFTLAEPLDETAATITVLENPRNSTVDKGRRLLRFGDELIEYTTYTTEPPYRFLGCTRGARGTTVAAHPAGLIGGLMDVDNWPIFVRFNQNTDIQHEVAVTLGRIYHDAGFRFVYFDGSEDTPPPYWFTLADAQWQVYRELQPEPAFTEASNLGHFDWHFVSRATAEDASMPEQVKSLVRQRRIPEIEELQRNFTRDNFGWVRFRPPGEHTIGLQPDMIEFVASRGAGWGCALSIKGSLEEYAANPRLADDLEVIRRWEDARISGWLTPAQQQELKNPNQEHTLLVDEHGRYELVPCRQIAVADGLANRVRAFLFERRGRVWVSYWDARGASRLALGIPVSALRLFRDLGRPLPLSADGGSTVLPAAERRFLEISGRTAEQVADAFARAKILEPESNEAHRP
ncbi:MAG TPA: hypothetical protein VG710_13805, partial [Opitutus sp.]|nr:hypothetical protein [Opitutus sp.]